MNLLYCAFELEQNFLCRHTIHHYPSIGTGDKLQSFDVGGVIPGPAGVPVPIIAHGQEAIFNPSQLNGLFRLLANPSLIGTAASVPRSETNVENHIDMSVNGVTLEDRTDAEILYSELEKTARRMQTMGVKSG